MELPDAMELILSLVADWEYQTALTNSAANGFQEAALTLHAAHGRQIRMHALQPDAITLLQPAVELPPHAIR